MNLRHFGLQRLKYLSYDEQTAQLNEHFLTVALVTLAFNM
jgi:hypothetical protein